MTTVRPWTIVVSEYLDLSFVLRNAGRLVVACRSAREALGCLGHYCPECVVVDTECHGADAVLQFAREHCGGARIQLHEDAVEAVLAG